MNALLEQYGNEYQELMNFKRWQTFMVLQPHTNKLKKPEDILKFTWDNKEKEKISKAEIENRKRNLLKLISKKI